MFSATSMLLKSSWSNAVWTIDGVVGVALVFHRTSLPAEEGDVVAGPPMIILSVP